MVLSICTLKNNIITYNYNCIYNLSNNDIIETISDSKILVFEDNFYESNDFVRQKKLRFFEREQFNFEKTSYIIWKLKQYGYVISIDEILSKIPDSIKYIKLNNNYNNPINYLPNSITHIIFGYEYNSHVDNLPFSIEFLFFGKEFNKPIDNLPSCLKKLLFIAGGNFNQSLDNIPNLLEYLFLPIGYSFQLDNLPNFLIELN